MRIIKITVCVVAFAVAGFAAPDCGGHGSGAGLLVSTGWLADHLRDPALVILAVGQQADYDAAHIPGSLRLDYSQITTPPGEGRLTLELPPMQQLAELFEKLGVSNTSRIVLYDMRRLSPPTARVFMTLDAMGMGARTSLLDSGFEVWQKEGRPVTKDVRQVSPGKLTPCPQTDVITDRAYVSANLRHKGVDIVDARAPEFYSGARSRDGERPGHIPGAASLSYAAMIDPDGKLKPLATLREQFQSAGVHQGDRVVAYCFIGQQASMVYFVSRYLGYDARLYDGSWQEWSAHSELPVEVAQQKQ